MKKTSILLITALLFSIPAAAQITEGLENEIQDTDEDKLIDVVILFDEEVDELSTNIDLPDNYDNYNISAVELEASEIYRLEEMDAVERIEKDRVFETQSVTAGLPKGFYGGLTGENVSVGVMDTGVEASHPYLDVRKSLDFTGEGVGDFDGHGTHVAGTIASQHPFYGGVAQGSDIYDVKVLNGSGSGKSSDILEGLDWSKENDIDILSMSIGSVVSRCNGRDIISRASNRLADSGTAVIVAAGNEGPGNSTVTSPGCAERVLTVGAADHEDNVASFSGRGPTADGRVKPDIVAPGTSIISTFTGETFRALSGTSMATPYVSGQAALMMEEDPSLEHDDIKATITGTAIDLGEPENLQGHGKANISASIDANHSMYKTETRRGGLWERIVDLLIDLLR